MALGQWYGPGDSYGRMHARMLASTADRERALDVLKAGYAEGRLSKDEHDDRVGRVQQARTYADLAMVTADLPGGGQPAAPVLLGPPVLARQRPPDTSPLAIASLACGIGNVFALGIAGIPAVILGHMALRDIRRTGRPGTGLAVTGLALGYLSLTMLAFLLFVVLELSLAAGT